MKHSKTIVAGLAVAAALIARPAPAADSSHPTVIELFQSQGCSSCPPANANVTALGRRPDVLTLSFQVTYWDQLGWKDTFAKPAFTARQWAYARAFHRDNVFTPEVVVNGRGDGDGLNAGRLGAVVEQSDRGANGPTISIESGQVSIGPSTAVAADVWLIRYDPRTIMVPIQRGENGGKTLPHKNIVRDVVRLGGFSGKAVRYPLPAADAGLSTAVLVQAPNAGAILAAARG